MRNLIALFASLFITAQAFAFTGGQTQNAPYNQTLRNMIEKQSADGQHLLRITKATWDFSKHGGAVGSISLGQVLPPNATIIRGWTYVVTQEVGATSTIAFKCASTADLQAATDYTGKAAGVVTEGVSTGTAANFKDSGTSGCTISAVIATAAATAGKINVYVEYVVHD